MQDHRTTLFEQHRRTLEGIAYRMLGTLAEARDVVQETYLKWHEAEIETLDSPRAWLITVCSRLALNQLQSARKQREIYVGEWLPEPFPDEVADDPAQQHALDDSVSIALLRALEKLSPVERAVFLLHDIFELSFEEVSGVVGKNSAHCRQLALRARKRVRDNRPRFQASPEQHQQLLEGFIGAAQRLDLDGLISLLAEQVEMYSDGGGKVEALPRMLSGATDVARFFITIFNRFRDKGTTLRIQPQRFNGSLGILMFENDKLATALTIEADAGRISHIYAVRNPDKFSGLLESTEIFSIPR